MGGWAIVCAVGLRVPYAGGDQEGIGPHGIADERYYYAGRGGGWATPVTIDHYRLHDWTIEGWRLRKLAETRRVLVIPKEGGARDATLELALAPSVPADVVTARAHVGILGYAAGLRVHPLDRLGLGDAVAAHAALVGRARPGHEKWLDLSWAIARFAREPAEARGPGAPPIAKVIDARAALACGELAELVEATTAPLTPARFAHNLAIAWRLTRFRFPADPTAARAALCR
jgi:arabinofuranosyltransferase